MRPTVLVTGGTQGIGRAVCEALVADHDLLVGGRDADRVAAVCRELTSLATGDRTAADDAGRGRPNAAGDPERVHPTAAPAHVRPFVADLADPDSVEAAVEALPDDLQLDGLVHSAGILGHGRVDELTRETWRDVLELNVTVVADLTRELLPRVRAARGTIVLVNSGSGLRASPGTAAYAASKFALRAFADALREEERDHGVRVSSVHPGRVATPMQVRLREQEGGDYVEEDYLRPESVAAVIRLALTIGDDAVLEQVSVRPR